MPTRETVSPEDILREAHAERPVREGTYLQRTGLRLAASVGSLGSIVMLALVAKWVFWAPSLPTLPPDLDPDKAKAIVENYKNLQQAALLPLTTLFDNIVVKVLLPVFTGILGYIYASRESKAKDQS